MKKIFALLLTATMLLALVACGGEDSLENVGGENFYEIETENVNLLAEEQETEIINTISSALSNFGECRCNINEDDSGALSLSISIPSDCNLSDFGSIVYEAYNSTNRAEKDFDIEIKLSSVSQVLNGSGGVGSGGVVAFFYGADLGHLADSRSGDTKITNYKSFDELADDFPALKLYMEQKGKLSDEEFKIYNEVMEALNADPNRPENEILEEMAPNYNMTADELKDFMMDAIW